MRLKKLIMINRAPFNKLILDFDDENIAVLSGINGTGKTTIISHIVDAFYELAKKAFPNEFEDKPNKLYRVSSGLYSIDTSKTSIVYLRFSNDNNQNLDYIDIVGKCSEQEYKNEMADIENPIEYSKIKRDMEDRSLSKYWAISDEKEIKQLFENNIMTYFPAYRYETPHFLNDPYKVELKFKINMDFVGYLPNPIEVTSDLQQIANWIMDIVLDVRAKENSALTVFNQLRLLLSSILNFKFEHKVRFDIGKRNEGAVRLSIVNDENGFTVYPSIFTMSSGELALLCLFGELIKQADKIRRTANNVSGIVLIDEIDKHLHIRLQKDVLPKLIQLFPNIQFIVSSHSPFLSLGLEDNKLSYKIFDLDNGGIVCPLQENEPFRETYETMIQENERFADKYRELQERIHEATKPFIITEGKSDWKHLKAAMKAPGIDDLDIEFYEFEDPMGDRELLNFLNNYKLIKQNKKIIGIFDRDNFDAISKKNKAFSDRLEAEKYIDLSNNVFAFAIPTVNEDTYGAYTSIEHYYKREDLLKTTQEGRRLFLGEEFCGKGLSKDGRYISRCDNTDLKIKHNGIIDNKVFCIADDKKEEHSIALSKNKFAQLILDEDDFAKGFDFLCFQKIFDIIREICNKTDEGN